jgi:hypothetical protein
MSISPSPRPLESPAAAITTSHFARDAARGGAIGEKSSAGAVTGGSCGTTAATVAAGMTGISGTTAVTVAAGAMASGWAGSAGDATGAGARASGSVGASAGGSAATGAASGDATTGAGGGTTGAAGVTTGAAGVTTGAAGATTGVGANAFTARRLGGGVGIRVGGRGMPAAGVAARGMPAAGVAARGMPAAGVGARGIAAAGVAGGVTRRRVFDCGRGTPAAGVGARRGGGGRGGPSSIFQPPSELDGSEAAAANAARTAGPSANLGRGLGTGSVGGGFDGCWLCARLTVCLVNYPER